MLVGPVGEGGRGENGKGAEGQLRDEVVVAWQGRGHVV
jgi:hypothetical protein